MIAQFPNPPLWIFLGAVVVRAVASDGAALDTGAAWVGTAAITWWAGDELIRGVNPWRRLLGVAGLGYAVINTALPQWLWTRASALVSAPKIINFEEARKSNQHKKLGR